jgi:hypothetical protein
VPGEGHYRNILVINNLLKIAGIESGKIRAILAHRDARELHLDSIQALSAYSLALILRRDMATLFFNPYQ